MVGTLPAFGFGDVLTGDPAFGVPAFRTLVGPIFYSGIAFEFCRARQNHRRRAFRAGRSRGKVRNAGLLCSHTPTPAHITVNAVPIYNTGQSSVFSKRRSAAGTRPRNSKGTSDHGKGPLPHCGKEPMQLTMYVPRQASASRYQRELACLLSIL